MKSLLNLYYPSEERYNATFPAALLQELQNITAYHRVPGPPAPNLHDPEARKMLYEAEILLTGWGTPALPADLAQHGRVRYICHVTGAVRRQIPRELLAAGVVVSNWGTSISRTIAEAALMMILGCLRRVRKVQEELHNRKGYSGMPAPDSLFERRVGLYGFGSIARELVVLLRPFQVKIAAYDPYVPKERLAALGVEWVPDLPTLFAGSDIISVHAANTPETKEVINHDLLSLLPDNGVIVNTARGPIIKTADLLAHLQAGRLWAALDVYDKEPLPVDSPLRGLERLLLFPHQAGPTLDRYIDMGRYAVDNIRRYTSGEPVLSQLTLEQYDIMT